MQTLQWICTLVKNHLLSEETLAAASEWVEKLRSSNSSNIRGVLLAAKANIFFISVWSLVRPTLATVGWWVQKLELNSRQALASSILKAVPKTKLVSRWEFSFFNKCCWNKSWDLHQEPFFYLANEWHKLHGEQAAAMAEIAWVSNKWRKHVQGTWLCSDICCCIYLYY